MRHQPPKTRKATRRGVANSIYVIGLGSIGILAILSYFLFGKFPASRPMAPDVSSVSSDQDTASQQTDVAKDSAKSAESANKLFMYCAAGMRYPLEEIAAAYQMKYGVSVQLQYGGSNTLLNQLEASKTGDLYLAADESYTRLARQKGLVDERLPVARMRPVIAVKSGNPRGIKTVADLSREGIRLAMGDPDAAAIGKRTRRLLSASGDWQNLKDRVTVYKPTVNEVANAVKLGSVDAGIVWDTTIAQYQDLEAVHVPELEAGTVNIEIAVVRNSKQPTTALRFARFVAARDQGLEIFAAKGFEPIDGDLWSERPSLTLFAGAVNRRALEPIVKSFEQREGVQVTTVYNGCGILTAQMRTMMQNKESGFPDTYMACDVYYLNNVREWFQDAVNVSDTDIVIVVKKGNPKGVRGLEDLARAGVRVALGQPEQCTIGVLSRRLLQSEGIYETLFENGNVVTQTATSALLLPNVITGSADAVLAYRTDTRAESARIEVIDIDSPLAKAIQPYSIARRSDLKYLGRRLFDHIARSRERFESAGFNWRLDGSVALPPQESPRTDDTDEAL